MNEYLSKFKDLGRGMPLRDVLTLEWVLAVQDCLRALAEGRNIQPGRGIQRHCNDGRVWLDAGVSRGEEAAVRPPPLTIVAIKPDYIPEDPRGVPKGSERFWITWGFVNNKLLDNWDHVLDVSLKGESKYVFLKVDLNPAPSRPMISKVMWETWNTVDEKTSPNWEENGNRPSHYYIPLGGILVKDDVATAVNGGGGSILMTEHVSSVHPESTVGIKYEKSLAYTRLVY